ncbi:hypothetical protein [Gorillibacterium sp. sgz5001074]|uniref:hypothetical protein n=1 Tax=Gorillibacterium sp. sgz5001074 TaxID=3446695 RepID=UPI003F67A981
MNISNPPKARIVWEPEAIAAFPGAERLVTFIPEELIETEFAPTLSWNFASYSPHNPE